MEVVSFGCRLNTLEGEAIRALAVGEGAVVNTCAVTRAAERDGERAVARFARAGVPVVATGCAVQIDPVRWAAMPGVARVLGNQEKLQAEAWGGEGSRVAPIGAARGHAPVAVDGLLGRARAFMDVQQGCDHACTFCIIPQGRGPSRSVRPEAAVAQMRRLVSAGVQEVVLTGVDLASWSHEGLRLGDLVRTLLRAVPGLPRLRLGSLDPAALDEPLWAALAEERRLMPHLHLSLQAGSDLVLKRMRRRHGRAEALHVIERARRLRPGLGVGADLIAGFPTETEALFAETLAFVDEAALPALHVFPYSPRPGTPAARMPPMRPDVARERAARLRAAVRPHAAAAHSALLGHEVAVVAERGGRGHTEAWAPARFISDQGELPEPGRLVRGRVVAADADGVEVGAWR